MVIRDKDLDTLKRTLEDVQRSLEKDSPEALEWAKSGVRVAITFIQDQMDAKTQPNDSAQEEIMKELRRDLPPVLPLDSSRTEALLKEFGW